MNPLKNNIRWREIPFVRILIPYLVGVLISAYCSWEINIPLWMLATLGLMVFLLAFIPIPYRWRYGSTVIIGLWLLLFGISNGFQQKTSNHPHFFYEASQNDSLALRVMVTERIGGDKWVRYLVKVTAVGSDTTSQACGRLLLFLEMDEREAPISGDILNIKVAPQEIPPPKNPHAFDARQYWANQNVYHQAFANRTNWSLQAHKGPFFLLEHAAAARNRFLHTLQKQLPKADERAVAEALILGYKKEMDTELRDTYARTGAMHVLAVSGLHVGIVSGMLLLLFRFILPGNRPRKRWLRAFLTIVCIWCFALITGMAASVMRAALMFSLLIIGKAMNRNSDIYNIMAASAFLLLSINPFLIKDIGFQLSYAAVLGIIFFQPRIYKLLFFEEYILDKAWQLTAVSLAAQLSTLPFALYYFHQFPVYFWLSGLVVVPLAALILYLGLLLFFVDLFLPFLATVTAKVLYWVIWFMNAQVFMIEKMPFGLVENIWLRDNEIVLLLLGLCLLVYAFFQYSKPWLYIALSVFLVAGGLHFYYKKAANTQQKLIVYHHKKGLLIDFIKGRKVWTYRDSILNKKQERFAAINYRASQLINEFHQAETGYLLQWNWAGQLVLAIKENANLKEIYANHDRIDYLLIQGKPWLDFDKIRQNVELGTVIFTANSPKWLVKKWKVQCELLGIPYFDIEEAGAFIVTK